MTTPNTATIYTPAGAIISEGLQTATVCDQAIQVARKAAADRGVPVVLDDDDGVWLVQPDGSCHRIVAGPWASEARLVIYRIETRPADSNDARDWAHHGLGDPDANAFGTEEEAKATIEALKRDAMPGDGWGECQYRVVAHELEIEED